MRSARSRVLVVLLLTACTRDNPAFDGGDGDETRGSATASNGDSNEGGTTTLTTAGPGDASETRTTTDASADGVSSDGPVATAGTDTGLESSGVVDTGFVCVPMFPEAFTITSSQAWMPMPCPPTWRLQFTGSFANGGLHFEGDYCKGSTCACGDDEVTLDFQVPVPMPESTDCFDLLMQLVPETCEILAYMIIPVDPKAGPQLPSLVVSNVVDPNFGAPGLNPVPLVFAMAPSEDCGGSCPDFSAGYYDLVSVEHGTVIPQDQTATVGEYAVFNEGSGIGQDCTATARWTASRDAP